MTRHAPRFLAVVSLALLLQPPGATAQGDAPPIVFVLLSPDSAAADGAAGRGVRFGAEEAAHTARLLGRRLELRVLAADDIPDLAVAVREARSLAVFSLLPATLTDSLAAALSPVLFVSPRLPADSLPRSRALASVVHVLPPDSARARLAREAGPGARATLWHPALERYGAAQLTERYRERFREELSEAAWAGWFAVKAAAETALRARSPGSNGLGAALRAPGVGFDGHKGARLRFDPADGQLHQPLYLVDVQGRVVEEVAW